MPFIFDDERSIVHNDVIKDLPTFFSGEGYAYNPRRFIGYLTIAFNYSLGGLEVAGYHAVNLLIHLGCGLLVYLLAVLTFRTPKLRHSRFADSAGPVALFAALLFVAHPVQTLAVTYVIQRLASLATLFYLLSLTLYISASLSPEAQHWRRCGLYLFSLVSAVLAMNTKEISFTLPFAIVLYELLFLDRPLAKRLSFLLPFALTLPIIPLAVIDAGIQLDTALADVTDQASADVATPRHHYLFTQFRVIVTYLRLLLVPVNQNIDYDYPLLTSFLSPPAFLSFLLLAGIACAAAWLLVRVRRGADPAWLLVSFGVFWFFLSLSVESSLIPIKDVIFEHRLYLPTAGAFIGIAAMAAILLQRLTALHKTAATAMIITALAGTTFARNSLWRDEVALARDTVAKSPQKARPHANLAGALLKRGLLDEALKEAELSARMNPAKVETHNLLGMLYGRAGSYDRAIASLLFAVALDPDFPPARENLGDAYRSKGLLQKALEQYQVALKLQPFNAEMHNKIGVTYGEMGDLSSASGFFNSALRLDPSNRNYTANLQQARSPN